MGAAIILLIWYIIETVYIYAVMDVAFDDIHTNYNMDGTLSCVLDSASRLLYCFFVGFMVIKLKRNGWFNTLHSHQYIKLYLLQFALFNLPQSLLIISTVSLQDVHADTPLFILDSVCFALCGISAVLTLFHFFKS